MVWVPVPTVTVHESSTVFKFYIVFLIYNESRNNVFLTEKVFSLTLMYLHKVFHIDTVFGLIIS